MKFPKQRYYKIIGISKQGFSQWSKRQNEDKDILDKVMNIVFQIREDHPGMGLRYIWKLLRPGVSREIFELTGRNLGLQIKPKKNYRITTNSRGVKWCKNLIEDMKVDRINLVWVSDITYYRIKERFYYITLIMDYYSRLIIGFNTSKTLEMIQTTMPALNYALKRRNERDKSARLIFHSDGGGQYYATDYRKKLASEDIERSMSKKCLENAKAERLNGTIKNYYLAHWNPQTFEELQKYTVIACTNYNARPHQSLQDISPLDFELSLK